MIIGEDRSDGCTSLHLRLNPPPAPAPAEIIIRCSNLLSELFLSAVNPSVNNNPSFLGRSKHPTATDSACSLFLEKAPSSDLLDDVGF